MDYFMPTRLYTGENAVSQHQDALAALGTSCVIVTGKQVAQVSGALDDVLRALAAYDTSAMVWKDVTENPPVLSCMEAGRLAAENNVQFVLGIGGGSSLDAAKAVAVFAANPQLDEEGFYAKKWDKKPLPIALVGTTAGTGSEVTKVSVLTDSQRRKHSIHDDLLYAKVSFGDSRYIRSCPRNVTLSCGVDVLAHATESYFSRKADEISRAFATRAIRLAIEPLSVVSAGNELSDELYRQLYEASILGGLAINTTGTCFPHNVGYYLTENYGVAHGFACATFLPAMLASVREADPAYSDAFCSEVGIEEGAYIRLIEGCLPAFDFDMTVDEIDEALPRWENNGSVKNTRADVTIEAIRNMLVNMFA
ncbi:MAG: iron-containing alcohol dehydrogenase [Atopobiaceae bacterium]|nr:iron-containing alcohol dehydrogenase [Atopobiaceae bacterium]